MDAIANGRVPLERSMDSHCHRAPFSEPSFVKAENYVVLLHQSCFASLQHLQTLSSFCCQLLVCANQVNIAMTRFKYRRMIFIVFVNSVGRTNYV